MTVEIDGKDVDFKVLHVLEFTSDRKKSSVVLRREDGSLVVRWRGVASFRSGLREWGIFVSED